MVSALYIVLSAVLLFKLSLDIVQWRSPSLWRPAIGRSNADALKTTLRLRNHAAHILPLATVMLIMMEMNGAPLWLVHVCGILLFIGLLFYHTGLRQRQAQRLVQANRLTYFALLLMVVGNLCYLPWENLFTMY